MPSGARLPGSQHSLSQGCLGGWWVSHPDGEKVGEAGSKALAALLTAACPSAVNGTSADGPAHGEAESDLLRGGNCGVSLSILIFIPAIVAYGSIKTHTNQQKQQPETLNTYGRITWSNLRGSRWATQQWEGSCRGLLASFLDPAPGKQHGQHRVSPDIRGLRFRCRFQPLIAVWPQLHYFTSLSLSLLLRRK